MSAVALSAEAPCLLLELGIKYYVLWSAFKCILLAKHVNNTAAPKQLENCVHLSLRYQHNFSGLLVPNRS